MVQEFGRQHAQDEGRAAFGHDPFPVRPEIGDEQVMHQLGNKESGHGESRHDQQQPAT
ncbi:MAG TPA: hypothetical protein VET69_03980 [Terriglobales bacterium]|nr:hypothetical protein [Terriglobales bacterium]